MGDPKNVQNGFLGKLSSVWRGQRTEREASSFPFFGAKKEIQEIHFPLFFMSRDASTRGHKIPSRQNQHSSFCLSVNSVVGYCMGREALPNKWEMGH